MLLLGTHGFSELLKSAFLGVIEGLTEFIPVSSTSHLVLFANFINFHSVKNNLFEVVIQIGAVLAIIALYRKKIFEAAANFLFHKKQKFALNILLAFLPSAFIGLLLHSLIKKYLFSTPVISVALILGGIAMILIDRDKKKEEANEVQSVEEISYKQSLLIGICQSLAIVPGVSRSGATIIGGMFFGLSRKISSEFSFFLAIPTILSAGFYDLYQGFDEVTIFDLELILIGGIFSFITSILVIRWFISFVSKHNFLPFAIYRIILGTILLSLFIIG